MNRRIGSGSPSRVSALAVDRAKGQVDDQPGTSRTAWRSIRYIWPSQAMVFGEVSKRAAELRATSRMPRPSLAKHRS